jgi:hypothetical protein
MMLILRKEIWMSLSWKRLLDAELYALAVHSIPSFIRLILIGIMNIALVVVVL